MHLCSPTPNPKSNNSNQTLTPMAISDPPPISGDLWRAVAGRSVTLPSPGDRVFYFADGHAEHAVFSPDLSSHPRSFFLCRILSVLLLSDPSSDEVLAKIHLCTDSSTITNTNALVSDRRRPLPIGNSFAKVLTPSDANNGGGFSVPRFCADSILPGLDYTKKPPKQVVRIKDMHGKVWEFQHIYRGTPKRHLFTTGWSKFVCSKKLVAGDSVVFYKDLDGEIFVGVRRGRRSLRGRVGVDEVVEAVRAAEIGRGFQVVYYPGGGPEFVVKAELVEAAMQERWGTGARVRMAVDDDSSRTSWNQGTITSVKGLGGGQWPCSPWRMIQVAWDEIDLLYQRNVSPWQIEIVMAPLAPLQVPSPYTHPKRLRSLQSHEFLMDGEGDMLESTTRFGNAIMDGLTQPQFNQTIFPAGMQGARQDPVRLLGAPINEPDETQNFFLRDSLEFKVSPNADLVSTELNICSSYQSESSSSPSQTSVLYCKSTAKSAEHSFMLFGKLIQIEQVAVSDGSTEQVPVAACTGDGNIFLSLDGHRQLAIE